MSTGVPATVACDVPVDRTLRLTELAGTMAYGYDARRTPLYEANDEGYPPDPHRFLVSCDLATGVVTRLEIPEGARVFMAGLDRGEILLNDYGNGIDPWLVDVATGELTPVEVVAGRSVTLVAIDDQVLIGEETLETSLFWQIQPAILDLRPGGTGFGVLTSYDIGIQAARLRPVDLENRILVGDVADPISTNAPSVWAYALDGSPTGPPGPLQVSPEFRGLQAHVAGFDGRTIVGIAVRARHGGNQPFAWTIGDPHITWLPLPDDQAGGKASDIQDGVVVGMTYAKVDDDDDWHNGRRAIVWDLASGAFLDLGTGPAELSGAMATELSLPPQSLAVAVQGDQVLGFLGDGCIGVAENVRYCSAASFGGTSVVWDIRKWLASVAP
jgi:hypothetical protein